MILLVRKKRLFLLLFLTLLLIVSMVVLLRSRETPVFSAGYETTPTVVIDPGHGGEDGGAVSKNGVIESGINLAIGQKLCTLLQFLGQETAMTRTTDISVYTEGAQTLRQKKISDLKNRVAFINQTPNAILVSIHQNSMPAAPSAHGAHVFYGTMEGSQALASDVQDALNLTVNSKKGKISKPIDASIYLMKHVTKPAILAECGFLSNQTETEKLQTPTYQTRLSVTLAAGILSSILPSKE